MDDILLLADKVRNTLILGESHFREFKSALPTLDKTIGKVVSIPVGWWVTPEEREYIVECIKKGW